MISDNVRTTAFKKLLAALPVKIQEAADDAFATFKENPDDPILRRHPLKDNSRSDHKDGSFAVSVTYRYRAIYFVDEGQNVWYWIGSHEDYNNFVGK